MTGHEATTHVVPIDHGHVQEASNSPVSIVELRNEVSVDKCTLAVREASGVIMTRHNRRVHSQQRRGEVGTDGMGRKAQVLHKMFNEGGGEDCLLSNIKILTTSF